MLIVEYEKAQELFDWMLDEIETHGVSITIVKDGKPMVRLEPADSTDLAPNSQPSAES